MSEKPRPPQPDTGAFMDANRRRWDDLVPFHARSELYELDRFKHGQLSLAPIEREEVGDVHGKSLLHLQCHFGMDTLSWARLGARVTGVDFSDTAIALARSLSDEVNIPARFIRSNVYELPRELHETFDIVFTSYGVLCWLPDISQWASVIARFLKPNGTFYIVEDHPLAAILSDEQNSGDLEFVESYFTSTEPQRWEGEGSYTGPTPGLHNRVSYEWQHPIGEIVSAISAAGLHVEFLHEFPVCAWPRFPSLMERGPDGWWRLTKHQNQLPLIFSLKATKTAET